MRFVTLEELPELAKRLHHKGKEVDFFPTPHPIICQLFHDEQFQGSTFEPACGDGRIWLEALANGIDCRAADLLAGTDFLQTKRRWENIITNPPYSVADQFVAHALELAEKKVAMLLPIYFLGGVKRYEKIWSATSLKSLIVFNRRIKFSGESMPKENHAWFVWDKEWRGETLITHVSLPEEFPEDY